MGFIPKIIGEDGEELYIKEIKLGKVKKDIIASFDEKLLDKMGKTIKKKTEKLISNKNINYSHIAKRGKAKDVYEMLDSITKNSQEVIDTVISYVIRTDVEDIQHFHEFAEIYSSAGSKFAAITYSFLTNEENINTNYLKKNDRAKFEFLGEFAYKCIIAMGFNLNTDKASDLSCPAFYKTEVMNRHLGVESFLGKKRGNNEYDKKDIDHWGLLRGDFFIQSKYVTKVRKGTNPERHIDIPKYYGKRSGMYNENVDRIIKIIS